MCEEQEGRPSGLYHKVTLGSPFPSIPQVCPHHEAEVCAQEEKSLSPQAHSLAQPSPVALPSFRSEESCGWQAGVMEARSRFLEGLSPDTVYAYRSGQGQRQQEFLTEQKLLYPLQCSSVSSQKGTASSHKL